VHEHLALTTKEEIPIDEEEDGDGDDDGDLSSPKNKPVVIHTIELDYLLANLFERGK